MDFILRSQYQFYFRLSKVIIWECTVKTYSAVWFINSGRWLTSFQLLHNKVLQNFQPNIVAIYWLIILKSEVWKCMGSLLRWAPYRNQVFDCWWDSHLASKPSPSLFRRLEEFNSLLDVGFCSLSGPHCRFQVLGMWLIHPQASNGELPGVSSLPVLHVFHQNKTSKQTTPPPKSF